MNTAEHPNAEDAEKTQRTQSISNDFVKDLTSKVIGAAFEVQRVLGVGLLESAYAAALAIEMTKQGLAFEREVPIAAQYKGQSLGVAFRADFVVQDFLLLEIKAQELLIPAHRAQLLSYLRVSNMRLGLLINFHATPLRDGICRVANQL